MPARYIVHREGEELEVTVTEEGEGYKVEWGDKVYSADYRTIEGSHRSLLMDKRSYEVATMKNRDGLDVYVSGDVFQVKVTDELWARAAAGAEAVDEGGEIIMSPMPGAVLKISVKVGDVVEPGTTVAVVEAMKMQNDLAAQRGGRVKEVRAEAGAVVDQGAVLVVLEPLDGAA